MLVYLLFVATLVRTSTATCRREEQGLSVAQLRNTNDAWAKCPGECEKIGIGWQHNGHWWHDKENKGKSVCHCVKGCLDVPDCPVGELPLAQTKQCSLDGYTCTATDGPECCDGRDEETRQCIPCDETRLRRDIHEVYKTAGSCEVYRCKRGFFDVVRMCEENGEWCGDHDADENGCLACSHCLEADRAQDKCPECLGVPAFYIESIGACRGGKSPAKDAGRQNHKNTRDCENMCNESASCTGYVLPVNEATNWCETYLSKGAEGDGRAAFICNMKAYCEEFRHKRHCRQEDNDCIWIGTERDGTCVNFDSIPDKHCILITDKLTCHKFDACAWTGRRGCINFTPDDCKYYRHSRKKCEQREECEFDAEASRRHDRCRASE